jgi:hypothetical protein
MPEPKGSAVAEVKAKLAKEYAGGESDSKKRSKSENKKIYGTLNKIGLMRGNEPTAKGMKQSKARDTASPRPARPAAGRPARGRGL